MKEGYREVLIVDSYPLIRGFMSHIINAEFNLVVCGEADSMSQALEKIKLHRPDLVIVDIALKDGCGIGLIEYINAYDPQIKILVASMNDEAIYAERVLVAGAQGYVDKGVSPETFLHAIRQVLKGKIYLSTSQRDQILNGLVSSGADAEIPVLIDRLSNRELTVFELLGQGLSNRIIAAKLKLSVKTIEAHQDNIKKKLGYKSSRELIRNATLWSINDDKYRMLFERMTEGVFYQRADGSLVDCNPALLDMFGLTREQFLGMDSMDPHWKVINEDGSELLAELHPSIQALRTGKSVHGAVAGVYNPVEKKYVWLTINAFPIFKAKADKPYEVFVTLHRITDRKDVEDKPEFQFSHFR